MISDRGELPEWEAAWARGRLGLRVQRRLRKLLPQQTTTQPQKQEHNNKKHNNSSAERAQAQFQEKKAGKVKQQSLQEQRIMKESEKDKE